MTIVVGAFEAKTKLSELLDKVEHGEEVIITRRGKEVARLVRQKAAAAERTPEEQERIFRALMQVAAEGRKIIRETGLTVSSLDHDELLYDERGLPK